MIFEISCSADLACDQKNSGASMGGSSFLFHLGGASLGNNLASQLEPQGQISGINSNSSQSRLKNTTIQNPRFQSRRWYLFFVMRLWVQVVSALGSCLCLLLEWPMPG